MFHVVFRRNRDNMGRFGNDDEIVWANTVRVKKLENGDTEVTCVQHDEDENNIIGVGPKYVVSPEKFGEATNNGWSHFFVVDGRTKTLIWTTTGRMYSRVYSE